MSIEVLNESGHDVDVRRGLEVARDDRRASRPARVEREQRAIRSGTGLERGADLGAAPFGLEPQRILRLEKGHVIVSQDTDSESNLLEAAMPWLVKNDKDFEWVGKWATQQVADRGLRWMLVGFESPSGATSASRKRSREKCLFIKRRRGKGDRGRGAGGLENLYPFSPNLFPFNSEQRPHEVDEADEPPQDRERDEQGAAVEGEPEPLRGLLVTRGERVLREVGRRGVGRHGVGRRGHGAGAHRLDATERRGIPQKAA